MALITGGLTLIGTVISVKASANKTEQDIRTSQTVTGTKLEELTSEAREHNNFTRRMTVV